MKRNRFLYEKSGGEKVEYDLLITNSTSDRLYGIDLNKLNEEEKEKVIKIQKEYEFKMEPYIKTAFRQFKKESILEVLSEEKN